MALYSVWDWDRNAYRLYRTRKTASVGDDPIAPQPSGLGSLGADPDTHVKPLPSGAQFVGYSHVARGEIRRRRRGLTDVGDDAGAQSSSGVGGWGKLAIGVVIGAVGMLWWRDERASR